MVTAPEGLASDAWGQGGVHTLSSLWYGDVEGVVVAEANMRDFAGFIGPLHARSDRIRAAISFQTPVVLFTVHIRVVVPVDAAKRKSAEIETEVAPRSCRDS